MEDGSPNPQGAPQPAEQVVSCADRLDDPDASAEEESPVSVDPPGVRRRLCGKQPPEGWHAFLGVPVPDEGPTWEPDASEEEGVPVSHGTSPPAEPSAPVDEPGPPPRPCGDVSAEASPRRVRPRLDNPLDDSDGSFWEESVDDGYPLVVGDFPPGHEAGPLRPGNGTPDAPTDMGAPVGQVATRSSSSGTVPCTLR